MREEGNQISPRLLAHDMLMEIEEGAPSHIVIRNAMHRHPDLTERDRRFVRKLVLGTTENRILLDYRIDQVSKTPARKMKRSVRTILRMALYQIEYLDSVPEAAAVNEAGNLARKRAPRGLVGFVNGVLRGYLRRRDSIEMPDGEKDPEMYLSVRYSVPKKLISRWRSEYGDDRTEIICDSFGKEPPLTVRLRPDGGYIPVGKIEEMLAAEDVGSIPAPYVKEARILENVRDLESLKPFAEGLITAQDVSSMLAVLAAGIKPGDTILDLCAAPGGKSLFAADLTGEGGSVTARDVSEEKAELLRSTMARAGAEHVRIQIRDASVFDPEMENSADVVLADLPCSGLGVIRRKPDIRYGISDEKTESLVRLQREILKNAVRYVKPGGTLLYSTCTFDPRENEENARWILRNSSLKADPVAAYLPEELREEAGEGNMLQLLPGVHSCDGFFIARFRRPPAD